MNKPISISKDSTIYDAIRGLRDKKISRLLVSDDEKYTSIITEKDVGLFLLADQSQRNLDQIPITEVMKILKSTSASTSIKECAQTMIENEMGSTAVRLNGSIDGIVTKTDLTKYFAENYQGKKTVGEYTTWYYAWMYSDTPLFKVVKKMIDEKISRIILRNHNEIPIGILAFRDLFEIALDEGNIKQVVDNTDSLISVVFTRKGFLSDTGFGATITAQEIMTDKIISVNYDDDLAKACEVLLDNKINAVGVVSSRGNVIGILSKTDITRALAYLN